MDSCICSPAWSALFGLPGMKAVNVTGAVRANEFAFAVKNRMAYYKFAHLLKNGSEDRA